MIGLKKVSLKTEHWRSWMRWKKPQTFNHWNAEAARTWDYRFVGRCNGYSYYVSYAITDKPIFVRIWRKRHAVRPR